MSTKTKPAKETLIGITDVKRRIRNKKRKGAWKIDSWGICSPAPSRNEYHIRIDKKREKLMTMSKGNFSMK
jgi:hypothetical protein